MASNDVSCKSCQAPLSAGSLLCEYCGAAQKSVFSGEEELEAVRALSAVAQRLATKSERADAMKIFWQTAFIPTTVEALRIALQSAIAALPEVKDATHAKDTKELFGVVHARVVALADALQFHPHTNEHMREEVRRQRRLAHDRSEQLRILLIDENIGFLPFGVALLAGELISHEQISEHYGTAAGWASFASFMGIAFAAHRRIIAKRPFDECDGKSATDGGSPAWLASLGVDPKKPLYTQPPVVALVVLIAAAAIGISKMGGGKRQPARTATGEAAVADVAEVAEAVEGAPAPTVTKTLPANALGAFSAPDISLQCASRTIGVSPTGLSASGCGGDRDGTVGFESVTCSGKSGVPNALLGVYDLGSTPNCPSRRLILTRGALAVSGCRKEDGNGGIGFETISCTGDTMCTFTHRQGCGQGSGSVAKLPDGSLLFAASGDCFHIEASGKGTLLPGQEREFIASCSFEHRDGCGKGQGGVAVTKGGKFLTAAGGDCFHKRVSGTNAVEEP